MKPPGYQIRLLTGKLPGHRSHCNGWARWCREWRRREQEKEFKELEKRK
jgi:hypothetical protein